MPLGKDVKLFDFNALQQVFRNNGLLNSGDVIGALGFDMPCLERYFEAARCSYPLKPE